MKVKQCWTRGFCVILFGIQKVNTVYDDDQIKAPWAVKFPRINRFIKLLFYSSALISSSRNSYCLLSPWNFRSRIEHRGSREPWLFCIIYVELLALPWETRRGWSSSRRKPKIKAKKSFIDFYLPNVLKWGVSQRRAQPSIFHVHLLMEVDMWHWPVASLLSLGYNFWCYHWPPRHLRLSPPSNHINIKSKRKQ